MGFPTEGSRNEEGNQYPLPEENRFFQKNRIISRS